MSAMANPIVILNDFQAALDRGANVDTRALDGNYMMMYDEPGAGRRRFSFVKLVDGEVQALAIFGLENPIQGITCYNVGYAVKESLRGRGLAVEAVNIGLEKLKVALIKEKIAAFYLEAVIDEKNRPSLSVAKKLFPRVGQAIIDGESGTPSLHFIKLVKSTD